MKPIGGYFELELPCCASYHKGALALNTGRNCLEYILRARSYKKVYLPYYACEVLLEPFAKLGTEYSFYHINAKLELSQLITLDDGEALLYINYFGLKQDYTLSLARQYGDRLIVDNTQAFYAKPLAGVDTFYSCRKFFGVSDGAYLYCSKRLDYELEPDLSWERMDYLLKRIDLSPEAAYGDFRDQSMNLKNNPIRTMSPLTSRIMMSIDYEKVAERRCKNYRILDMALRDSNGISMPLTDVEVPMVYPYYVEYGTHLRQYLIEHQVFCARYWPNVLDWCSLVDRENLLVKNLVCIPIDQRYNENDMQRILDLLVSLRR